MNQKYISHIKEKQWNNDQSLENGSRSGSRNIVHYVYLIHLAVTNLITAQ
jgi:hypothetical protein